ncbi:MAG: hypothetical protein LBC64_04970 [Fibromonadaceae bacterium]|jgi:hypothetical protein|nr:hypothetical protein [Fibromonadaceae bacterium]
MLYSPKIREEELKNKVAADFFAKYDCTDIIKDIDFAVKLKHSHNSLNFNDEYLLWAEAKSAPSDILVMLTQLVLTIGKARTFNQVLPPKFLGCFDCEKIAFIPYADIQDIFHQNDFNWKAAPSNRESKEFKQIYEKIKQVLTGERTYIFKFSDENNLKLFILKNFLVGKSDVSKIRIDKNNFISIYSKWLEAVKPTISVNWDAAKKKGILSGHFYIADLISDKNTSLKENLMVVLRATRYEMNRHKDEFGAFSSSEVHFNDKQRAHNAFWAIYERPPKEDYWDYIIERQDLLVPQDVRERKGSFFTPQIWVELSQKYIAEVLGEDWQDEYYVWDCAAGTGNLLAGLTNKYNIWASTLDKADVNVMHDRIENGANLLKEHCFQFDFLNDDFDKLPKGLRQIIDDPKKRKKLVVYINPPYVEADNRKGEGRAGVATSAIHQKYSDLMGYTKREIYIQFLTRIYCDIRSCYLANFSKLKNLQAPNFLDFRNFFLAKLEKLFIVPADTFDNVSGQFPIGFFIWDTSKKEKFKEIMTDVFSKIGEHKNKKRIFCYDNEKFINDWVKTFRNSKADSIATIIGVGNDFQNQRLVRFGEPYMKVPADNHNWQITKNNLIESCIYFAVRKIIPATWLNDRDQFLYPNDGWETDLEFQNDCLVYTLFNNNISSKYGINHWIPFIEWDVGAHDKFDSHFMTDFIAGKIDLVAAEPSLFYNAGAGTGGGGTGKIEPRKKTKLKFSEIAKNVFKAGKELWKYYHAQPKCNVNASLYDIREHFQGRNAQGKMNNKSDDEQYNELIGDLREKLKILAKKIEPKVYEYGFLKA